MHAEGKLRRRTQIEGPNLSQLLQQIREICRQWLLLSSKSLLCYHTFLTDIWKSSKSRITSPHKSPALPPQNPITTEYQRNNSRLYRLADALTNDKCGLRKHRNGAPTSGRDLESEIHLPPRKAMGSKHQNDS